MNLHRFNTYFSPVSDDDWSTLRIAFIAPLLKKPNLSTDDLLNYWPASNLPFIAKLLEKVVASRITSHVDSNCLLKLFAFQSSVSISETWLYRNRAAIRLLSDLTAGVEAGTLVLLELLDMSAAFDTVDYEILLERLDKTFGIRQDALKWISSYLSGRMQSVVMSDSSSQLSPVTYGVPQVSVLGLLLFILYTDEMKGIAMCSHANDSQLFFSVDQINCAISWQLLCAASTISQTEFLWAVTSRRWHLIDRSAIAVSGADIKQSKCVKLLGVHIADDLSFRSQVNKTVSTGVYQMRQIKSIRRRLPTDAAKSLINDSLFHDQTIL